MVDCDGVLDIDPSHSKARTRKLRILEAQERHTDALVEVCAMQLKFMQDNRDQLRMGIQVTPPVPQSKIEDLMGKIVPTEIEKQLKLMEHKQESRPLPSTHTISQLLQSFTSYNSWMATAAREGNLDSLSTQLNQTADDDLVQKVQILLKRGRRYAFHRKYEQMKDDFEAAYDLLEQNETLKDLLPTDTYARILEWVGMCRHLRFDMEGALKCYETCSDLEPTNVSTYTYTYIYIYIEINR